MNYYIIVFKNTYDAMNSEKKLNDLNYEFEIMPTPTSITMSCGICVKIEKEDEVKQIINQNLFEYKQIYMRDKDGYKLFQK